MTRRRTRPVLPAAAGGDIVPALIRETREDAALASLAAVFACIVSMVATAALVILWGLVHDLEAAHASLDATAARTALEVASMRPGLAEDVLAADVIAARQCVGAPAFDSVTLVGDGWVVGSSVWSGDAWVSP